MTIIICLIIGLTALAVAVNRYGTDTHRSSDGPWGPAVWPRTPGVQLATPAGDLRRLTAAVRRTAARTSRRPAQASPSTLRRPAVTRPSR